MAVVLLGHRAAGGKLVLTMSPSRKTDGGVRLLVIVLVVFLNAPSDALGDSFPFTLLGSQFFRNGVPVYLNAIGYWPLEPGQAVTGEIREARVQEDLRRFCAYQGGSEPVLLRVCAQPTAEFPNRMPQSFYDGMRSLGFWIVRDIFFEDNYTAPDAITKGRAKVDAVIAEVADAGGLDRIFAWEVGNEFTASSAQVPTLINFICTMRDHIKMRMAEPGREDFSNWVTWGSWPPNDPLRTDGTPVLPTCLDFISYNAYSYDPERIRDHQAGPGTGTPFAGYLAALKDRYPNNALVGSETGLPDSPLAVGVNQARLPPWYPVYRRGALTSDQVAEGLADRYWDGRLSGVMAGLAFFEWNDEWWKSGDPATHNSGPEEWFGITRFDTSPIEARFKLQQETVRDLFSMQFPSSTPILTGLRVDSSSLPSTGTTLLHADVAPDAVQPMRFRWESSRGYITGDSATVQFYAGGRALGPARVTVVGIDASGRATSASLSIDILPSGPPLIEILTSGSGRASGRVADVDLDQYKLAVYVETDLQYVQPFFDMRSIWIGPHGYWWTASHGSSAGALRAYLMPRANSPPSTILRGAQPPGTVAAATLVGINDSDNDLLADGWEQTYFSDLSQDRYGDPDTDRANNLEEFLDGTAPTLPDNDSDGDGLADTWERRYFGRLTHGAGDDGDGDGLDNQSEFTLEIHPGRTAVDRDGDRLPDTWEIRWFGDLAQDAVGDPDGDGVGNLDAYELGLSPSGEGFPGPVGGATRELHDPATGVTTLTWPPIQGSTHYNTYRGTIPATMMPSRMPPYDHTCYESSDAAGDGPTMSVDATTPPVGTAFYYLMSGENACDEGSLGQASNAAVRPNLSPCPTPP